MAIMLRSHVTGRFGGKNIDMYVSHSSLSVSAATSAVYCALTGMTLSRRIRDWASHHAPGKPITLTLNHAKYGNEVLTITVIGRDNE